MKDILHPLCLIIAATGFLFLLRDLRKDRRDRALIALACAFLASALSFAISLTAVWIRIDGFLGVTNIAVPLAQSCVIIVLACQAIVLAHWAHPPDKARRRTLILLLAAAAVIATLAALFALLTPAVQRPVGFSLYYAHDPIYKTYLTIYIGTYTAAEVYLARLCLKHAKTSTNRWIAAGLRTTAAGAIITLGYSSIRVGGIYGSLVGIDVTSLEETAWVCGDIGATLTQVGFFLPVIVSRVAAVRTWSCGHYRHARLRKLWEAMDNADPSIVLEQPEPQLRDVARLRSADYPLIRRRTEIRDGQLFLRNYLAPGARTEAEVRRRGEGLTGLDLAAAVTADQIRHAIVLRQQDKPVAAPAEYADAHLALDDVTDEVKHLLRVASFFSPPPPETPSEVPATSTTSGVRS
ncbi:hypothetical protein OHS33_39260 (plasmid) [Streptomyces sp. NBC_00536]|uniref:MAB_1171c family putative transporter n=1 Tax=Streptomyces sp. NBC_00536 TaxID=2975769 RepID=UPI002E80178F|nr:MAB_1171c family putative transporter [Streptomyces sp. NBC_00536]WUC84399.1 hypothetical protein OHS33_39260 [Streptomyces sp. NBC_00536]